MEYRKLAKHGPDVSLLGFGCMRFVSRGGVVDEGLAFSQLKYAYDAGVNYFDTAYIYHGGKSEGLLGDFIKRYDLRDKVYIADKLPAYLVVKKEQIPTLFASQLKRLDTHYIDFYLMHMLTSFADWEKLKAFGIVDFIREKKDSGAIRHVGFSFHGRPEAFLEILEDYPWDFCQIQYNYLDIHNQAGIGGLKRAHELGIGVAIMEPLRGGALAAKAPTRVKELVAQDGEGLSPAYWGLRFVMNHPEVSTVLSGMNQLEHIEENIHVASNTPANSLTEGQLAVIEEIRQVYGDLMKVPCTGCNYCMPCPMGVDIPSTFSDYNSKYFFGNSLGVKYQYIGRSVGFFGGKKAGATQCISCGKCLSHCPQAIPIPDKLREAHRELNIPLLQFGMILGKQFLKR